MVVSSAKTFTCGLDRLIKPFSVIHRADYHEVMLETAKDLGVEVRLGCNVEHLDFISPQVTLSSGETLKADVIVGADGEFETILPYYSSSCCSMA